MAQAPRVAFKLGLILAAMTAVAVATWAASPMGSDPIYRPHLQLVY
jgi:hypothetical protein